MPDTAAGTGRGDRLPPRRPEPVGGLAELVAGRRAARPRRARRSTGMMTKETPMAPTKALSRRAVWRRSWTSVATETRMKKPMTTVGIPASSSIPGFTISRSRRDAISERKMPQARPTSPEKSVAGMAMSALPAMSGRQRVLRHLRDGLPGRGELRLLRDHVLGHGADEAHRIDGPEGLQPFPGEEDEDQKDEEDRDAARRREILLDEPVDEHLAPAPRQKAFARAQPDDGSRAAGERVVQGDPLVHAGLHSPGPPCLRAGEHRATADHPPGFAGGGSIPGSGM